MLDAFNDLFFLFSPFLRIFINLYFEIPLQKLFSEIPLGQVDKAVSDEIIFCVAQKRDALRDLSVSFVLRFHKLGINCHSLLRKDTISQGEDSVFHDFTKDTEFLLDVTDMEKSVPDTI